MQEEEEQQQHPSDGDAFDLGLVQLDVGSDYILNRRKNRLDALGIPVEYRIDKQTDHSQTLKRIVAGTRLLWMTDREIYFEDDRDESMPGIVSPHNEMIVVGKMRKLIQQLEARCATASSPSSSDLLQGLQDFLSLVKIEVQKVAESLSEQSDPAISEPLTHDQIMQNEDHRKQALAGEDLLRWGCNEGMKLDHIVCGLFPIKQKEGEGSREDSSEPQSSSLSFVMRGIYSKTIIPPEHVVIKLPRKLLIGPDAAREWARKVSVSCPELEEDLLQLERDELLMLFVIDQHQSDTSFWASYFHLLPDQPSGSTLANPLTILIANILTRCLSYLM